MPVWTSASALGDSIITTGSPAGQATVGGVLNVTGDSNFLGSVDVRGVDDIRVRFLNSTTFKAGLQVPTTAGDMITNSAVDDFCIRSQTNILFATGGATEKMRIDSSGQITNTMSGGKVLTDTNGFITSFQTLDVATAGGRYKGKSKTLMVLGQLMDRTIGFKTRLLYSGYITFDTSASGSTSPVAGLKAMGVAGASTPFYELVTCDWMTMEQGTSPNSA